MGANAILAHLFSAPTLIVSLDLVDGVAFRSHIDILQSDGKGGAYP